MYADTHHYCIRIYMVFVRLNIMMPVLNAFCQEIEQELNKETKQYIKSNGR